MGRVNGLGQSLASLSRTIGPTIGGALWGPSVKYHLLALNFLFGCSLIILALNLNKKIQCLDKDIYIIKKQINNDNNNDNNMEQSNH